ncbi:hypothetical protein E4T52_13781 [Aureobasidium sp. EXF-3400]|nr:hypothetical protein E4T51_12797 [Aureobasidium sp. EXF-12344]KAI4771222.1 hypothetical protein E4T52_13781 [Aureobasidium sp. EXF-3400]
MLHLALLFFALATGKTFANHLQNQTRINPALPGWHSDPSCVFVPEQHHNQVFCTSSTFMLTPGLPIYASADLVSDFMQSIPQSDGIWAATIRYHKKVFYIITVYKHNVDGKSTGLIFRTSDIYDSDSWSDPIRYDAEYIDPDLFWDTDGTAYVTSAGLNLQRVDLTTGELSSPVNIYNGTAGADFLEGPHMYKKDGYYYILAAEGGSGVNHTVIIARSRNITGPYQSYENNPVLTNRRTNEFFQNIGHADLFQDSRGSWWAAMLSWRSGPAALTYPMGREMSLTPVTWPKSDWPTFSPVRGVESTWSLPCDRKTPGNGTFVSDPDVYHFAPNSTIPAHFGYWRWPNRSSFQISPAGHPNTLELTPSNGSIHTGAFNFIAGFDIHRFTLIMRRQTDTLFQYSVDIDFEPQALDEEAGVTAFLNQAQNINLGIVMLPINAADKSSTNSTLAPHLRFVVTSGGSLDKTEAPPTNVIPVPQAWTKNPIRLMVEAQNSTHYSLSASSVVTPWQSILMGQARASLLSGGMGDFTGTLVGAYATTNGKGDNATVKAYVTNWRYQGLGQEIDHKVFVPSVSDECSQVLGAEAVVGMQLGLETSLDDR